MTSIPVCSALRKDQFASSQNGNKATSATDAEGTIYGQGIRKAAGDANTTIGVNIQNPHWFSWYSVSGYGNCPNKTPYYNSWSAKNKTTWNGATSTDNIVVKTIYDPCPVGYTTAPVNAFSNFTIKNWDSTNKGSLQQGCWFPATGFRFYNTGDLGNVDTQARSWQAVPTAASSARSLVFSNASADPIGGDQRSLGMSVRPVAEIEN